MILIARRNRTIGSKDIIRALSWLAMLVFGTLHAVVHALPGDLDSTFGLGGLARATVSGSSLTVNAAAQQRDGRIVVVGRCVGPTSLVSFCITRFEADGSFSNSTPGVLGSRTWRHSDPSGSAIPYAVAIDAQDRIIIGGRCDTASTGGDFCLVRLLRDGAVDTSFGTNGEVMTLIGEGTLNEAINALVIQPDGRIIAGGNCIRNTIVAVGFCLARYLPNGTLDQQFGVQGIAVGYYTPGQAYATNQLSTLALTPGGDIHAVGTCDMLPAAQPYRMCLMTFTATGEMPNAARAFSTGVSGDSYARAAALQRDGDLLIGGPCNSGPSTGVDFCLIRVTPSLGQHLVFSGGQRRTSIGYGALMDVPRAITVQTDGRIVLAGTCTLNPSTSGNAFCWVRYMANGEPDRSINGNADTTGAIVTEFSAGIGQDSAVAAMAQADGTLIVVGGCETGPSTSVFQACAARYQGGPFSYAACSPDIDGDGKSDPMIDGLIMNRIAAGMRDSAVMQGIRLPAGARRINWNNENGIAYYLQTACGIRGLNYSGFFTGF